jgi:multisubunit Na+/H+ antiporter MnhB subunit
VRDAAKTGAGAMGILPRTVAKLLFLPALVAAVAILVKGYAQTGDGFSAGVVASLAVVLQYLAFGRREAEKLPLIGLAGKGSFVGLFIGLLVAAVPVTLGDPVFNHYPGPGAQVVYLGTVELITPVLFDVGVFLLVFGFVVGSVRAIAHTIAREEEYRGPDADDLGVEEVTRGRRR